MSFLFKGLFSGYYKLQQWEDPRTKGYPLVSTPMPAFTVLFLYLYFIFDYGPKFMKNRKPYEVSTIIMWYNVMQMVFNSVGMIYAAAVFPYVSFLCTPVDIPHLILPHYLYFLLKVVDFGDTIFFVLRKKYQQITFLHLYHHISMMVASWVTLKYYPGGQLYFVASINCFVHLVMYFYYFLTSWDPEYKKNIWWKRHITQLQITQHCIIFVSLLTVLLNPECSYSKPVAGFLLFPVGLMIYLFTDFYITAYIKKKPLKKEE